MFKRLFTASAFLMISLLTGCNVPFVPLIQNEQESITPTTEEPTKAPLQDIQEVPSFYAKTQENAQKPIAKG